MTNQGFSYLEYQNHPTLIRNLYQRLAGAADSGGNNFFELQAVRRKELKPFRHQENNLIATWLGSKATSKNRSEAAKILRLFSTSELLKVPLVIQLIARQSEGRMFWRPQFQQTKSISVLISHPIPEEPLSSVYVLCTSLSQLPHQYSTVSFAMRYH